MLRPWEKEKLEEMRRKRESERPHLRVPAPEPYPERKRPEKETPARGVTIIDFSL